MIQAANGVVTAEEMAPYLDPPSTATSPALNEWGTPSSASMAASSSSQVEADQKDESFVLPALIKFGGEPFVDEEGHLLYRFPSLQRTVLQRVRMMLCLHSPWVGGIYDLIALTAIKPTGSCGS